MASQDSQPTGTLTSYGLTGLLSLSLSLSLSVYLVYLSLALSVSQINLSFSLSRLKSSVPQALGKSKACPQIRNGELDILNGDMIKSMARGLIGVAAAVSICLDYPALAESLAFPISHAHEVNTVQRTLVETWSLIRETFVDPTFNHQGIPSTPITTTRFHSSSATAQAGWFPGFGAKKDLPDIVKAGDPVLHEPAQDVSPEEIGSEKIQKIIDEMVKIMRKAPGVGLAAPQIGVPLKIIVLEDTREYLSYVPKEEIKAQDRRPFDLLVIVNPRLKKMSDKSAFFFEGCLSVDGFGAMVERFLDVEVTGLDRNGQPIKVNASGWQARILQHECDHLEGTLYVDKMVPRTFRTAENLNLPLGNLCPKQGVRVG